MVEGTDSHGGPPCRNSSAKPASTASCCWFWPARSRPSWAPPSRCR